MDLYVIGNTCEVFWICKVCDSKSSGLIKDWCKVCVRVLEIIDCDRFGILVLEKRRLSHDGFCDWKKKVDYSAWCL